MPATVKDAVPFDPNLPVAYTPILAKPLRDQFNALKALIDAVPVVNSALVDGVQTLPAGAAATASVTLEAEQLHFNFGIPEGLRGGDGAPGQQGEPGEPGPPGPPFAQATVDSVQTLPAGSQAWVSSDFDGSVVHLSFGIPEGAPGEQGPQGLPGEVTTQQLNDAVQSGVQASLAQSSSNSNGVQLVATNAESYYDQGQMQAMIDKMNELINALRR